MKYTKEQVVSAFDEILKGKSADFKNGFITACTIEMSEPGLINEAIIKTINGED